MSKIKITLERAVFIIKLIDEYGIDKACSHLGNKSQSLRRRLREIKKIHGLVPQKKEKVVTEDTILTDNTVDQKTNGLNLTGKISSISHDRVKILSEYLELCQVDLDTWEVERYLLNAWDVTMSGEKSSTNQDATYTNYQIKVWLVRKQDTFNEEEFLEQVEAMVKRNTKPVDALHINSPEGENLLVLTINDLHLGRMSWAEETEVNYDSKVASKYMHDGLESLLTKTKGFKIDRILYYVGHDFFTYDNATPFPATTKGTPQEADSRWQKMFMMGEDLQIEAIRKLSKLAPVTVQEISGNHDKQASFYLGRVLAAVFRDDPNVFIDHSPKPRQYFRWGENLIGAAHGQKEKSQDLHAVMMAEARKDMGDTKYWYMVMGHMHHFVEERQRVVLSPTKEDARHGVKMIKEVDEDYKGLTITYLPNLAERDDYEVEHCYIGTIRGALASVYSKTKGRIAVLQHNL